MQDIVSWAVLPFHIFRNGKRRFGRLTGTVRGSGFELAARIEFAVGVVELRGVGDKERLVGGTRDGAELDGDVQVVVGDVHEVLVGLLRIESRRALDGAGEVHVLRREGRFPHVRELLHDVGHGVLVGVVVHEHDDAVVVEDHLAEGGPLVFVLGDEFGRVEVLGDSGVLDRGHEVFDEGEVGVADEHGNDFEGVLLQPADDLLEFGLKGAGVEEVAGGVAVVEGFVDVVDLALDCVVVSTMRQYC